MQTRITSPLISHINLNEHCMSCYVLTDWVFWSVRLRISFEIFNINVKIDFPYLGGESIK
jgi:hypothetical protein